MSKSEAVFPISPKLIAHHGQTLFGPMNEWLEHGKTPSSLLLTGISGIGKREMGHFLAQWMLCETPKTDTGCGQCLACQRALKGSWVDFTEITAEEDSETLKIDQFRKLKTSIGFGAHEGKYKIILISSADRMTLQAANSLLKLLEEPPQGWIFILTANDSTLVLPTILSRCQVMRLRPLSIRMIEELALEKDVSAERAGITARLAQGSLSKALALSSDAVWEKRKILFNFIKQPVLNLNALVEWASQETSNFTLLSDQLEQIGLDLIAWSLYQDAPSSFAWLNWDGREALSFHANAVLSRSGNRKAARTFWIERTERLARARLESLAPLNRKLLTQDLLIPWLQTHP